MARKVTLDSGDVVSFGERDRMAFIPINGPDGSPSGLTIGFANGRFRTLSLSDIIERNETLLRGIKEKIQNEGSKESVRTVQDMIDATDAMLARIRAGTAFERTVGSVNRVDGILLEAFINAREDAGEPIEQADAIKLLMDIGPDQRRILAMSPELAPYMEAVRAERAKTIDSTSVLAKVGLGRKE